MKFKPYRHMPQLLILILAVGLASLTGCNNGSGTEAGSGSAASPATTTTTSPSGEQNGTNPDSAAGTATAEQARQDQARMAASILSQRPPPLQARKDPITISFREPVISTDQIGSSADSYLNMAGVTGKARFDTERSMVFEPEAPLAFDSRQTLTLSPEGLLNIPAGLEPITFDIRTAALELELQRGGLEPLSGQPEQMQLGGTLFSADYLEPQAAEKILQASSQQKPLPISWEHNGPGTEHRFVIGPIARETFAADLKLAWDGKNLGARGSGSTGSHDVVIPSRETFSVTRIEALDEAGEGRLQARVSFSDALDPQQDLKGLVQLGGKDARTQIIGSQLLVYPDAELEPGEHTLVLQAGIRALDSRLGKLGERQQQTLTLEAPKPAVRFAGVGNILPENGLMNIAFEARGVKGVDLSVMEIRPENIAQFLQVNGLDGDNQTGRVGRYVWRRTIPLSSANAARWNRFNLDARELFKARPGTLYRLELAVNRNHVTRTCTGLSPEPLPTLENNEDEDSTAASGWDGIENYVLDTGISNNDQDSRYEWDKREDPCSSAYYFYNEEKTRASRNFIASNIGLIAKQEGNGNVHVIATDLRDASPDSGVKLTLRNFQGQELASADTDDRGFATLTTQATPFLLLAQKGDDRAYLKLNANTVLETSQFEVSGQTLQQGLKGYLYGERGVWRPGDDIHLTFVLQDRDQTLPTRHPVTLQLFDPAGRLRQTLTGNQPTGPFYPFTLKTRETDPTGDWLVKAVLGGSTFDKRLKIETIRPNRLKVELDYGTDRLEGWHDLPTATLFAQWLHGGTAADLKADVSVRLREKTTRFDRYADFSFDDPARSLDSADQQLLEGRLDEQGHLSFSKNFQPEQPPPGLLSAWFTSRVFEDGGGFSISKQEMDYYPFANYIGLRLPKGDAERGMLLTDTDHTVELASLTAAGTDVSLPRVQVTLYKIDWKWWWDKTPESLAEYADASNSSKLEQTIVNTTAGKGEWKFRINYPDWGRYLVRACDLEGKHCSGKTLYVDWPGWAGRAQEQGGGAAARLSVSTDKDQYQPGDTAQVQLPEAAAGRALLTVENANRILAQHWVEFDGQRTQVPVPITAAMAPNAYVSVTLLQGHQQRQNDRPMRLYGIIPLMVEDPSTRLKPLIQAADEWKPESSQLFQVSEANGKPMDYTLAVVDEGLLGLTRFETPDLHQAFYRKEALGIRTWDLYDQVVGAYGGELERMLAIGGGDEAQIDDAANKPKRFPPVVKFLGAFHLEAGQTREHAVALPAYLGAMRIMLVAADRTAYGRAEQSVFVRQPLMLLSSLPRSLRTGESVEVPLTLFTADPAIKAVEVSMQGDTAFTSLAAPRKVDITGTGEKTLSLPLKAGNKPGPGTLQFRAVALKADGQPDTAQESRHEVTLNIQAPSLPEVRNLNRALDPGADWTTVLQPFGLPGSNQANLVLSAIPNLNLEQHLDYLVHYPHGCLEQVTSTAFPQLYLSTLLQLDAERRQQLEGYVKRAIARMNSFQSGSGNLMYWPGSTEASEWASLYAGHFLIEARKRGYSVPLGLLSGWQSYQVRQAQNWTPGKTAGTTPAANAANNATDSRNTADTSATQAYRLYVLALGEQPQLGAMNRLRESGKASVQARWLLAAAYQLSGQPEAARRTTEGLIATNLDVTPSDTTFSQRLGTLGLQLETLITLGRQQDAARLVEQLGEALGSEIRPNTHDLSWALLSAAHYLDSAPAPVKASLTLNQGSPATLDSPQALLNRLLGVEDKAYQVALRNDSSLRLYASLTRRGIAPAGSEQAQEQGLALAVKLSDRKGREMLAWNSQPAATPAAASPGLKLQQGQDYVLTVTVTNTGPQDLKRLALATLLPSGAEIGTSPTTGENSTPSGLSHQDVRDDRVFSYFDLKAGATRTVTVRINAAYLGQFRFPPVSVEAMYQPGIRAQTGSLGLDILKVLPVPGAVMSMAD
ncbi:MAG TPA: MG2 domain-containing protein [Thiolinea sp.]|nr:MG2 domain-containing protein [Thiolinea sp.]